MRSCMRAVIAACLLWSSGCALVGGVSTSDPPVTATTAPQLRNVRVRLDDHVAVGTEGSIGDGFDTRMLAAVRASLMARGLAVVTTPAEISLRLERRVQGAGYFIRGESILHVERDGHGSDEISTGAVMARDDRFHQESAHTLVTRLLQSPILADLTAAPPADDARTRARANAQRGTAHYNLDQF